MLSCAVRAPGRHLQRPAPDIHNQGNGYCCLSAARREERAPSAESTGSAVDDHLVSDPGLSEQGLDAAEVADVDAAVRGAVVAAGGEVG